MAALLKYLEPGVEGKDARPFHYEKKRYGREEAVARVAATSRCIYVSNLSFCTTDVQLHALFSRCGPVERVIMGEGRPLVAGRPKRAHPICVTWASQALRPKTTLATSHSPPPPSPPRVLFLPPHALPLRRHPADRGKWVHAEACGLCVCHVSPRAALVCPAPELYPARNFTPPHAVCRYTPAPTPTCPFSHPASANARRWWTA